MADRKDLSVSVIIPAYNVEKYIKQCILSVTAQSYSNIEIIIVNDGSTDKTRETVENLADADNRIKILNLEHSGVSEARNAGIAVSVGDYIVFVDGDDYLADDFVEYMLGLAKQTGADFCLSKKCFIKKDEPQTLKESVEILSSTRAVARLLSPEIIVGCWNKIYKKSFLEKNGIKFSQDLFYGEGLEFITKSAQASKTVAFGDRKVYYYRRNNQFSATAKFDIEKIYNGEKALFKIRKNIKSDDREISLAFKLHLSVFYLGALTRICAAKQKKEYFTDYKKWLKILRKNTFSLIFGKNVSFYRKALLFCGCISPFIMSKLDTARRKRIYNRSV